jgi:dihydrofolate reductase
VAEEAAAALDATGEEVAIGGAGLAAAAFELGLVDELRMFRYPVVIGGGTPFLPPVGEAVPLDLIETRTFGSRVITSATAALALSRTDTTFGSSAPHGAHGRHAVTLMSPCNAADTTGRSLCSPPRWGH